jgi:hypothetical protein
MCRIVVPYLFLHKFPYATGLQRLWKSLPGADKCRRVQGQSGPSRGASGEDAKTGNGAAR